jgi:hypothetical protein
MLPAAAEGSLRPSSRPQPNKDNPSTSDWSQADTVALAQEGPGEAFNMRVGIRLQLGLLVLTAVLVGVSTITLAVWVMIILSPALRKG